MKNKILDNFLISIDIKYYFENCDFFNSIFTEIYFRVESVLK